MNADRKILRIDGSFVCKDCKGVLVAPVYGGRKRRGPIRCRPCAFARYSLATRESGQGAAHGIVGQAIRKGLLQPPSAFTCVDCARPAEQYDHRDYGRPLDVDPVCRSCNLMRGPAVWRNKSAAPATPTPEAA